MSIEEDPEEEEKLAQMAEQAKYDYLENNKQKYKEERRRDYEKRVLEYEIMNAKYR